MQHRRRPTLMALVAVSLTGFGETGPERDRLAYGSVIDNRTHDSTYVPSQ